jgi:hypothetical protein
MSEQGLYGLPHPGRRKPKLIASATTIFIPKEYRDMTAEPLSAPAAAQMHQLLSGFEVSQALYVVAELGVATVLLSGPCRVEDLAASVGADTDALRYGDCHGFGLTS